MDVDYLIELLAEIGVKCYNNNNVIFIRPSSHKHFLKYIGSSPLKCFDYKWESK